MASEIAEVKPIHFFKIILTQSIHEGKLMIPKTFVKKYGEGLPKVICLKTPNGAKWKLNLVKSEGKIWFEKGWKEFAEYHSLAHGHLVLFRYEKTSVFEVHIFDKSALEISYPSTRVETKRLSNGQSYKSPNNEDCTASQKRKANSSFEFPQPHEIGSNSCVKVGQSQKVEVHHTHKKCKAKEVITSENVKTLARANSFKTCNPSFIVVMGASYVDRRFLLNIPAKFAKTHFDLEKKRGVIYFQVLKGRVWPARYIKRKSESGPRFELTSGWKAFAKDNILKVGDVCNFELILRTNMTFQVHIFRVTDKNCSTFEKSSQMK